MKAFLERLQKNYKLPVNVVVSDIDALEAAYCKLRDLMRSEYSMRAHMLRTAHKRFARHGGYQEPGLNFCRNASEADWRQDSREKRRSAYAEKALESAENAMGEYELWATAKYCLAVLTGRYDGSPNLSVKQDVATAFELRKSLFRDAWERGVAEREQNMLARQAWSEREARRSPPDNWGTSLDPITRVRKWFQLPERERFGQR
jgi:hypothetical protein